MRLHIAAFGDIRPGDYRVSSPDVHRQLGQFSESAPMFASFSQSGVESANFS